MLRRPLRGDHATGEGSMKLITFLIISFSQSTLARLDCFQCIQDKWHEGTYEKSIPSPGELGSMHPLYTFLFLLSEHEDCFKGVNPNKRGLPDFTMGGLRKQWTLFETWSLPHRRPEPTNFIIRWSHLTPLHEICKHLDMTPRMVGSSTHWQWDCQISLPSDPRGQTSLQRMILTKTQ